MQAIILAAGRGTRMGHLTETLPKPMLKVAGKNLLQHKIDVLPREIDEVIMVVGYLGESIKTFFGDSYGGKRIRYVTQEKLNGTGYALWQAKELLKDRFMIMMGDDIYSEEDILECIKYPWSILVRKSNTLKSAGGRVFLDDNGNIKEIIEGVHEGENVFISTALYTMTTDIFKYPLVKLEGKEEWGLPQTMVQAVKDFPIKVIESKMWLQLSNAKDLDEAEKFITTKIEMNVVL